MNKKNACAIVKDLLTLYCDNALRDESNQFVEEHLKDCLQCKKYEEEIKLDKKSKKNSNAVNNLNDSEKKYKLIAQRLKKRRIMTITGVILGIAILLFITSRIVITAVIAGESMEPTFKEDDVIVVNKISYKFGEPQRGDVVVFRINNLTRLKRIVGLPGETIKMENNKIIINGKEYKNDYIKDGIAWKAGTDGEITIPEDEYFVLGDNINSSQDSRIDNIGTINIKDIKGKVMD